MDVLASLDGAPAGFPAFLPQPAFFLLILVIGYLIVKVLTTVSAQGRQAKSLAEDGVAQQRTRRTSPRHKSDDATATVDGRPGAYRP